MANEIDPGARALDEVQRTATEQVEDALEDVLEPGEGDQAAIHDWELDDDEFGAYWRAWHDHGDELPAGELAAIA